MNHLRYDRVLSRLSRVRWHDGSKMWSACCPAHDDKNPSLWVWIGKTGNLIAKCKSRGCSWDAIVEATGTDKKDWFPEEEKPLQQTKGRIVATYPYHDEQGKLLYECCRIEPGKDGKGKEFRYRRPQPGGTGIVWNLDGVKKTLYRLPEILDPSKRSHPVFVTEGEKCADAIRWLGLLATTAPCGAEKWALEYGRHLAGRRVVILPDNDEPGWRHCVQVCGSLMVHEAAAIWILHLPNLPEAGDVVDWCKAFPKGTPKDAMRAELVKLVKQGRKWECK